MQQICIICGIEKSIESFEWQKNRPNPRKICKKCRENDRDKIKARERSKIYSQKRKKEQPELIRQQWERSVYGFAKEDLGYSSCMICGSTHRLCIDHCHTTNVVRGLLCTKCNAGLGMFNDDIDSLTKAIEYLSKDKPHFERKV